MSTKRHEDAFWLAPKFPKGIDELNAAYNNARNLDGIQLEEIGRSIDGFEERMRPTTSDHYSWFWALIFIRGKKEVMVAFPWTQDWEQTDGVQSDRSIAFYSTLEEEMLSELAGELSGALDRHLESELKGYLSAGKS